MLTFIAQHPLIQRLRTLGPDQRAVAATEFAMLLPVMLTLYLGSVEVSQAVAVDRKTTLVARTIADLVAQASTPIANTDMTNLLNAGAAVAAPYPVANLKITVSSIKIDNTGKPTVVWSDSLNGTPRSVGSTVTMPSALAIPNIWMIWSEVQYSYKPTIGYVVTGTMNLSDQLYMRPRLTDCITRTTSSGSVC
jgi:Flp pilus assembly protein TadG